MREISSSGWNTMYSKSLIGYVLGFFGEHSHAFSFWFNQEKVLHSFLFIIENELELRLSSTLADTIKQSHIMWDIIS